MPQETTIPEAPEVDLSYLSAGDAAELRDFAERALVILGEMRAELADIRSQLERIEAAS